MKTVNSLIGKYFNSFDSDGKLRWQGVVSCRIEEGIYLVSTFSWLDGKACEYYKIIKIEEMLDWIFYDNSNAMKMHLLNKYK